jgi:hypothetical protein
VTERRDPTIGTLPEIADGVERAHAPQPRSRRPAPSSRPSRVRRAGWIAAIVIVPLLAFALYEGRDALGSRLLPPSQQTQLMQRADAALRAGKLTSTDGSGARELYEAVLARDADSLAAREGLVHVGTAALAQAQAALRENRLQDAQRELDLARALAAPVADLQRIEDTLRRRAGSDDQIATLLAQADAAERAGHLDDGNRSALARYQQALDASPDNAVVLARRQALLSRMLAGVDAMLAKNDIAGAQRLVDRVVAVDPGHMDLPAARARLGEVVQQRQKAQARDLDAADAALHGGRIDAAIAGYRAVQAASPNDLRARAGLRSAADVLLRQANRATADFDFTTAESALTQVRALTPESPTLRAAEQRLQQARARLAGVGQEGNNSSTIDDLLAAADHAIVRDELVDPPGDSAFDKLRAASAIAPGDPRVIAATRRFGATAIACFQREMTGNRLVRAEACLDALIATDPTYAKLPSMRQGVAARWLAVADERLGAGELGNAQRAIASAQRWAPNDPAIPALLTRLQQARAGIRR